MKKFSILMLLALFVQCAFAQDSSEKNLVKSLDPAGATSIVFDFKHKEIKSDVQNNGMMRVELLIKANMPEAILDQLVKAGRYTIESVKNADGSFSITAPNLSKAVTIKGKDLEEEIIVLAQTPTKYVVAGNKLEKETPLVAARGDDEKAKAMKAINEPVQAVIKVQSLLKAQPKDFQVKTGDILIDGVVLEIK